MSPHDLGRRWLAAGGPWLPGMRCRAPREKPLEEVVSRVPDEVRGWLPYLGSAPDLRDPATLGAAVGHLREVYGDPRAALLPMEWGPHETPGWGLVLSNGDGVGPCMPTEAEAVVAALEAHHAR